MAFLAAGLVAFLGTALRTGFLGCALLFVVFFSAVMILILIGDLYVSMFSLQEIFRPNVLDERIMQIKNNHYSSIAIRPSKMSRLILFSPI